VNALRFEATGTRVAPPDDERQQRVEYETNLGHEVGDIGVEIAVILRDHPKNQFV